MIIITLNSVKRVLPTILKTKRSQNKIRLRFLLQQSLVSMLVLLYTLLVGSTIVIGFLRFHEITAGSTVRSRRQHNDFTSQLTNS